MSTPTHFRESRGCGRKRLVRGQAMAQRGILRGKGQGRLLCGGGTEERLKIVKGPTGLLIGWRIILYSKKGWEFDSQSGNIVRLQVQS